MLIGELSRQTGVHTHQLRYYEAQGLLAPGRGTNGYRDYTDDAVVTVVQIRKLLEAGLSTQEIAFVLPCATGTAADLDPCPELLGTLRARLRSLDDHIDTLTRSREALRGYLDAAEQRLPGPHRPGNGTLPHAPSARAARCPSPRTGAA